MKFTYNVEDITCLVMIGDSLQNPEKERSHQLNELAEKEYSILR